MEPRPQRPRAQPGQQPHTARTQGHPQASQPAPAYPPGEYPEGMDPTSFIAPARTEYDYSPLDLAPPGQRRRRQFVAAAVGGLSVVLLGAILFFSYLLLRDEDTPSQNDDLLAAQTQIANDAATVSAGQTVVAQAGAEQTAQAQTLNPQATGDPAQETAAAAGQETPAAGEAPVEGGDTPPAEDTAATGSPPAESNAPDLAGGGALSAEQLTELLPAAEQVPEALTAVNDTSRTQEEVVDALGGGRPAETGLEEWGWTGNVERQFSVEDPATADSAATTYLAVSLHGFASPDAAAEALPFFSDTLINSLGYTEGEAPAVGDAARLLTITTEAEGTNATLYVQDGAVLYRILGFSGTGDPTQDLIDVATNMLGG
ncbi:MAG: hypothetical protein H0T72_02525 [Chloroflexia bacterium]|nr:hypothetical protein [Chloroflexia bacterium]